MRRYTLNLKTHQNYKENHRFSYFKKWRFPRAVVAHVQGPGFAPNTAEKEHKGPS